MTIYLLGAVVWFFVSDIFYQEPWGSPLYGPLDVLYVFLTAALLYLLIRRAVWFAARSEARQRLLFNNMREAAFLHEGPLASALAGNFADVNDAGCACLGYTRAELLNMRFADIVDTETLGRLTGVMERLEKQGTVVWEGSFVTRHGRCVPVEMSWCTFEFGGRAMLLSIARDMTERRHAQETLLKHKELLETAAQAARVALWEWDVITGEVQWSAIIDMLTGYGPGGFPRRMEAWREQIHPEDRPVVARAIEAHFRDEATYVIEYRLRRKDGTYSWWCDMGTCRRDDKGRVYQMAGACVDISKRKAAEEGIAQQRAEAKRYLDVAGVMLLALDVEGRVTLINRKGCAILDYDEAQVIGRDWFSLCLPPDKADETRAYFRQLMTSGEAFTQYHENVVVTRNGARRLIGFYNTVLYDQAGRPSGILSSGEDVTEQRHAEESLAQERHMLRTLIDNLPASVYVKDKEGRKIITNRSDLDLMGVRDEALVIGKTDAEVYPRHLAEQYARDDATVLHEGQAVINREEIVENAQGVKRWLLTSKIPLKDADGHVIGLVGIGRDITDRRLLESRLMTMAHYDALTSLPNRTLFMEKASMSLAHAKRAGTPSAILFVDLDHFKSVNDTMGHSVGDELLKDTALKLADCIREADVMARLGGDEFIILLNGLQDAEEARRIAERIRDRLNVPRFVAGNDLFITASIGIVTYPHDGDTLEDLLKNADTAMYAAKNAGRNTYCFYDRVMNQHAVTKMQIERGLREALIKKELALYYQPVVNVKDGRVRGFESLMRWFRAEGGLVLPDEFIPVAEETGLIVPIGEWALYEACRFARRLIDAGLPDMVTAVNVSVVQLRRKNIVEIITSALRAADIPPQALEIEITETMLIESFDTAIETLSMIRALGVRVSLDDFGTGYSSLVHLQRLPIVNLKIDRFFIREIAGDSDEGALISTIIELAHKLKLSVVAEGVETDIQLQKLAANGCDYFQGFLLSRPLAEPQVWDFLAARRTEGLV